MADKIVFTNCLLTHDAICHGDPNKASNCKNCYYYAEKESKELSDSIFKIPLKYFPKDEYRMDKIRQADAYLLMHHTLEEFRDYLLKVGDGQTFCVTMMIRMIAKCIYYSALLMQALGWSEQDVMNVIETLGETELALLKQVEE